MSDSVRIVWGYESETAMSAHRREVMTDFSQVVNPHMAILGDTGTGKTHTIRHAINEVIRTSNNSVRFHLFDVHGDIDIDRASTVTFSESQPYGFNPIRVDPDPNSGGVRKSIQNFIDILGLSPSHGRALGPKQQDILRNLCLDVLDNAGFAVNDPSTWHIDHAGPPADLLSGRIYLDIPFDEKDIAKRIARDMGVSLTFDGKNSCWHADRHDGELLRWPRKAWGRVNPTLADLCRYGARRREMLFTGLGQKEAELVHKVNTRQRALQNKMRELARSRNNDADKEDIEEIRKELEKAKEAAVEATVNYINGIETGSAMQAVLKYDSYESLSTVKQILDSLYATGIFRETPPNFDPKRAVWRYEMSSLSMDEQIFLVNFRLREIFANAIARGESNGVLREVIVIDEGAKFTSDDDKHIINRIALEARKFGLGIWFASQSPTHYPEALMSSMASKVVLGLDPGHWNKASSMLQMSPKDLKWIRARETLLVKLKLQGQSDQQWCRTTTPNGIPSNH